MCEIFGQINQEQLQQLDNFRRTKLRRYTELLAVRRKMSRFRYWSQEAYRCFISNYDCENCTIKNNYGIDKCQMRQSVEELLDAYGVPKNIKLLEAKWKSYDNSR